MLNWLPGDDHHFTPCREGPAFNENKKSEEDKAGKVPFSNLDRDATWESAEARFRAGGSDADDAIELGFGNHDLRCRVRPEKREPPSPR